MHGKVFESIYDGTLHGHWQAIVTMQVLVTLADNDGRVAMSALAISERTGIPVRVIQAGLDKLAKPDPFTRLEFQRGGYIIPLAGGGFEIAGYELLVYEGRLSPWRWALVRVAIFERDGYRCVYCGDKPNELECDHVVPVSRGGSNDPSNLATACVPCNRSKGGKTVEEWRGG